MSKTALELEDIQSGVLSPRPSPYVATYILLRIDYRKVGRELMRKLRTVVASVGHQTSPAGDAWVSVSLSFQGLKPWAFRKSHWTVSRLNFNKESPRVHRNLETREKSSPEQLGKTIGNKGCSRRFDSPVS